MRLRFIFILLSLATQAVAQELPTSEQVCVWTGFPAGFSLNTRSVKAEDDRAVGTLVVGRRYFSDKSGHSYFIKLFAPDSFLCGQREELFSVLKKFQDTKPASGFGSDIGSHQTGKGQPFWIIPGGAGPGGGSMIAFASTKQFDVVVEEFIGDSRQSLEKTHEEDVSPTRSLSQLLEAVLAFLAQ